MSALQVLSSFIKSFKIVGELAVKCPCDMPCCSAGAAQTLLSNGLEKPVYGFQKRP